MKLGNGVGEGKNREHREDLHPVVEIPEVGAGLTAVKVVLATRHLMLKLPYRTCSAGLIWTLGSCRTQAGAKHRSDKTQPGSLKNMEDKIKVDRHQLHRNTHLLLVGLLSILVDLGPKLLILWVLGPILPWFHLLGPPERAGRAAATVAVVGPLCLGESHHLQAQTLEILASHNLGQ